ncbi:MAG: WG repeat-containing protein [Prevotella sp.]|nr:WG repeat-containing protein [Prevotella sp.]
MRNRLVPYFMLGLVVFTFIPLSGTSQIAEWQMKPIECVSLTRFAPHIFQMEKNGKKGLVKEDGTILVDAVCTEITLFYDHHALLLAKEKGQTRVLGNITDTGEYNLYDSVYYALEGQYFYSDGLLSVMDENGRKGYIDEKGQRVEEIFKEGYDIIKPFTEGYAAVFKNDKYFLINKTGKKENITLVDVGKLWGGTNVFEGEAYVWDEDKTIQVYNVETKKCTKKSINSDESDYLYCFSEVTKRASKVPFQEGPRGVMGMAPTVENGLWGYVSKGITVLPPQFDYATQVEDGLAVVRKNGKYGIVRMIEDTNPFDVIPEKESVEYWDGDLADCTFDVNTPEVWGKHPLKVKTIEGTKGIPLEENGRHYAFSYAPQREKHDFEVEIICEDLILFKKTLTYAFEKKMRPLVITISVNQQADKNGKVGVSVEVSNPNISSISTTITIDGGNASFHQKKIEEVTIKGGQSKIFNTSFYGVNSTLHNQYVTVTTSNGKAETRNGVDLIPYPQNTKKVSVGKKDDSEESEDIEIFD